jgi:hypothetical protein
MGASEEYLEALRDFNDAYQHLMDVLKEVPKNIDLTIHVKKTGRCITIEDLSCAVVYPVIYEKHGGYGEAFDECENNVVLNHDRVNVIERD